MWISSWRCHLTTFCTLEIVSSHQLNHGRCTAPIFSDEHSKNHQYLHWIDCSCTTSWCMFHAVALTPQVWSRKVCPCKPMNCCELSLRRKLRRCAFIVLTFFMQGLEDHSLFPIFKHITNASLVFIFELCRRWCWFVRKLISSSCRGMQVVYKFPFITVLYPLDRFQVHPITWIQAVFCGYACFQDELSIFKHDANSSTPGFHEAIHSISVSPRTGQIV